MWIPSEITFRIIDGEVPIKVWREYRQISLQELEKQSGISTNILSQLESLKRQGTMTELNAIAQVLRVSLEDLVK